MILPACTHSECSDSRGRKPWQPRRSHPPAIPRRLFAKAATCATGIEIKVPEHSSKISHTMCGAHIEKGYAEICIDLNTSHTEDGISDKNTRYEDWSSSVEDVGLIGGGCDANRARHWSTIAKCRIILEGIKRSINPGFFWLRFKIVYFFSKRGSKVRRQACFITFVSYRCWNTTTFTAANLPTLLLNRILLARAEILGKIRKS